MMHNLTILLATDRLAILEGGHCPPYYRNYYKFMFPIRFPIFNDPGKSFEVQIIGPDLDRLNQLEQQLIEQISALPGVAHARSNAIGCDRFLCPQVRASWG